MDSQQSDFFMLLLPKRDGVQDPILFLVKGMFRCLGNDVESCIRQSVSYLRRGVKIRIACCVLMLFCQRSLLIDGSQIRIKNILFDIFIKEIEIPIVFLSGLDKSFMDQIIAYCPDVQCIVLFFFLRCRLFLLLSFYLFLLFSHLVSFMYSKGCCSYNHCCHQQDSQHYHAAAPDHLTLSSGPGDPPSPGFFPESFLLHLSPFSLAAPAAFAHDPIPFLLYDILHKNLWIFGFFSICVLY